MRGCPQYLDVPFCGGSKDSPDLEVKATMTDEGRFEGWGAIFDKPDAIRDVILPGAFTRSLTKGGRNGTGVAMLYQHDAHRPIGVWEQLAEKKKGLWVMGHLALDSHDGHDAYALMKMGALRGLSIGYEIVMDEIDRDRKIRKLKEIDLWEVSPVTFPMHAGAQISAVKSSIDVTELKQILEQAASENELENLLIQKGGYSRGDATFLTKMMRAYLGKDAHMADNFVIEGLGNILQDLKKLNKQRKNTV